MLYISPWEYNIYRNNCTEFVIYFFQLLYMFFKLLILYVTGPIQTWQRDGQLSLKYISVSVNNIEANENFSCFNFGLRMFKN
jgi:hypothetical protein